MSNRRLVLMLLTGSLTLLFIVPVVRAQPQPQPQGPPQWWALDSAPPGTPPTLVLDPSMSTPQQTVLDVTVHGFYFWTILASGQTFRRLSFEKTPDYARYRMVGRPELPALHHTLAALVGTTIGTPTVQVLQEVPITSALIYPFQNEGLDHEGDPPPPFQWDQSFYQATTSPYPSVRAQALGRRGRYVGMELIAAETYPLRYIPASQTLYVTTRYRVTLPHPGTGSPTTLPLTRRQARQARNLVDNWQVVAPLRPEILSGFAGDYLIITPSRFLEEIDPLADQKRRRGYAVTVVTTSVTGVSCVGIQDYIADWWSAGNPARDHYVLLVGDVADVPTCTDENENPSDKVYACISGTGLDGLPDPYPEVSLGRFPCDTESDCTSMVTKTLEYEDGVFSPSGDWLDDVLLAAHDEAFDGFYQEAHEVVRTAAYATAPNFDTAYGRTAGVDNADVIAAIESGRGVVAYRGHGSSTAWTAWNIPNDYFDTGDVAAIDNGEKTPVVLGIACTNSAISATDDCLGEEWMETTERAVAHYGATVPSGTTANHVLDRELFDAIYNYDFVILAEATAAAEVVMIEEVPEDSGFTPGEYNAWIYMILGDPELKIWREAPSPIVMYNQPSELPPGPTTLQIQVKAGPTPVPLAIVSVYKDGEFAENRYSDSAGWVHIPIDPESPGVIELTAYTEFDSRAVARDEIVVDAATAVPERDGTPSLCLLPASPNPIRDQATLRYGLPAAGRVRLVLIDVSGRQVAVLADRVEGAGWHEVRCDTAGSSTKGLTSGVYFARLEFGGEFLTRRLLVVK